MSRRACSQRNTLVLRSYLSPSTIIDHPLPEAPREHNLRFLSLEPFLPFGTDPMARERVTGMNSARAVCRCGYARRTETGGRVSTTPPGEAPEFARFSL